MINTRRVVCPDWNANVCQTQNCAKYHPHKTCDFWQTRPFCEMGSKCTYKHPTVPCKFGSACRSLKYVAGEMYPKIVSNCECSHRKEFGVDHIHPGSNDHKDKKVCWGWNDFTCLSSDCKFYHPPRTCILFSHPNGCMFKHCSYRHPKLQCPENEKCPIFVKALTQNDWNQLQFCQYAHVLSSSNFTPLSSNYETNQEEKESAAGSSSSSSSMISYIKYSLCSLCEEMKPLTDLVACPEVECQRGMASILCSQCDASHHIRRRENHQRSSLLCELCPIGEQNMATWKCLEDSCHMCQQLCDECDRDQHRPKMRQSHQRHPIFFKKFVQNMSEPGT